MEKIKVSICLSDIPQESIFTSDKNGKKYLTCDVVPLKNGADQYGNTHSVSLGIKQEDGTWQNTYIGKGKIAEYGNGGGQQQQSAPQKSQPKQDLPF